jgi:hypothetical protein
MCMVDSVVNVPYACDIDNGVDHALALSAMNTATSNRVSLVKAVSANASTILPEKEFALLCGLQPLRA